MNRIPPRVAIYPRDIENLLGKHNRTACRMLQRIRKHYKKQNRQPVTVTEFCSYTNMEEEVVRMFIK
jgi:hypothetical protein